MSSSSHYHFSAVAAIASIAIASLALTTTSYSTTINKRSLRMSKGSVGVCGCVSLIADIRYSKTLEYQAIHLERS